jgi:putative lipoic acid-binding regulatory protein
MSEPAPSLLEFPCDFPIKALGLSREGLERQVLAIVLRHAPDLDENAVTSRRSGGGKYTAVTVALRAQSQAQLDAIYQDLTACPEIAMAL